MEVAQNNPCGQTGKIFRHITRSRLFFVRSVDFTFCSWLFHFGVRWPASDNSFLILSTASVDRFKNELTDSVIASHQNFDVDHFYKCSCSVVGNFDFFPQMHLTTTNTEATHFSFPVSNWFCVWSVCYYYNARNVYIVFYNKKAFNFIIFCVLRFFLLNAVGSLLLVSILWNFLLYIMFALILNFGVRVNMYIYVQCESK